MTVSIRTPALGAAALIAGFGATSPLPAAADSCWTHNGSIMRLEARGSQRWFSYERPRAALSGAGVRPGTLLFNGTKDGNSYEGTARVFSKYCPGDPLEYRVSGPVSRDQTRVTLYGEREVWNRCQPTGRYREDVLVFDYSHQC